LPMAMASAWSFCCSLMSRSVFARIPDWAIVFSWEVG
jgi:hypothetical protein